MIVSSENDLTVHLGKKEQSYYEKVYPKVDIIARTEISPDIDLLEIDTRQKEIIGYEVKYLKYRKAWNRFDYRPIYEGLGQALLYFNYGIDKVFLVIGFDTTSVPGKDLTKLIDKMPNMVNSLISIDLSRYLGLRLIQLLDRSIQSETNTLIIKGKFCSSDKDIVFRKQCLFKGEFHWNKNLYNKIYH